MVANGCFLTDLLNSVQLEQGTVVSLLEENGTIKGVRYKNKAGEESTAFAALTIVCDGCFSNLRRSLCNPQVNMLFSIFSLSLTLHTHTQQQQQMH